VAAVLTLRKSQKQNLLQDTVSWTEKTALITVVPFQVGY
jgi:hypothetical protein